MSKPDSSLNPAAVWLLWRVRGLHTHLPPSLARPVQQAVERAVRRSPSALSILCDTDKGPKLHNYTGHYKRFLGEMRTRPVTLLELGVYNGASVRMWRKYMPRANIIGVDLNLLEAEIPGVELHQGDQSDAEFLGRLTARWGGFDIIIDDASHIASLTLASFAELFPALRPGGWYVIEDLQTSYSPAHEGGPVGTPGTAVELVKTLVDRTQEDSGNGDVAELHVFDRIVFIRKALG